MKVRFVGDPRYRDNPKAANDPDRLVYRGKTFPKGEWVTIDEKNKDKVWAEQWTEKLKGNAHFEVDGEPAAPGMEPYKEDKEATRKREAERKAREEGDARSGPDVTGVHSPDRGPVKDIGQENIGGPPTAGPEADAMLRGLGSVDSPTDSPSRNPAKRENLLKERDAAIENAPPPKGKR